MLKIKIASSEEINNSKKRWNDLVKSMKFPTVFLTWEWITTWLKHFGKDYESFILFIYEGTNIVAIVPLAQRTMKLKNGFLKVKILSFCGSMELYPNYIDIICKDEKVDVYIEKIFEFFTHDYTAWDVLNLAFLTKEGHLSSWIQSSYKKHKIRLLGKTVAPFISISNNDLNTFLKGFNRKKRHELNREKRILFDSKNVTFHRIKTKDEQEQGLETLFQLHKARSKEKRITSTFAGSSILNFHRAIARIFLELGWLHLYVLKNGDKVISAAYCFEFGKRFYYYQSGLDPQWQQYSPGKILILKMLEVVFNNDILEFDFLGGEEGYKFFWTKDIRFMMAFNIYNDNMAGIIEYWSSNLIYVLKFLLKKIHFFDVLKQRLKTER